MGRRHTAGAVGNQGVGGVQVDNTTLTAADDLDITVDPSGTGIFKIAGDAQLQAQGDLRFADADSSNYVAFQAPTTIAANLTWTLPAADGTSTQAIVTDGSGTLSFATVQPTVSDETTSATTHYVIINAATSGAMTSPKVSSTKMTYQPSTGSLTLAGAQTASNITSGTLVVTGGVGISGALYVGADIYSYASSDIRLKENISKIDNSLEKLLKISGYQYHWNKIAQEMYPERTMQDVGVIAQEVKEVVPSAVAEREEG